MTTVTGTAHVTDPTTGLTATGTVQLNFAAPTQAPAVFGASLGPVKSGDPSIATWISKVGRPMAARHFFADSTLWASYAATPFNAEAGVRKILCDFELAKDGSDLAAFDALLKSCRAAGLEMDITLYHAAPSKGFGTPQAYWTAVAQYVPTVYKYGMRHIFDLTSYQIAVNGNLAPWYPGPGGSNPHPVQVSAIGVEYYSDGYDSGQRLDAASAFATSVGQPFGLCEYGMNFDTAAGGSTTEAQGLAMLKYVYGLYAARIAAGHPVYDCLLWSNVTGNTVPGWVITNQPPSWINGTTAQPGYRQLADLLATA